jgi:thiol-disulfide isomerase/thioredoxin
MGDFTLTDTDGNIYTMSNLLKEKELIILDFWFVNCGPCKAEFPYFEAITEKYDNVQLLTLNHIDSEKDILALRDQMGVTFPMIVENIGFQQGFGISAYPFTVFIDGNGRILKIHNSVFSSQADLEALIDSLLK